MNAWSSPVCIRVIETTGTLKLVFDGQPLTAADAPSRTGCAFFLRVANHRTADPLTQRPVLHLGIGALPCLKVDDTDAVGLRAHLTSSADASPGALPVAWLCSCARRNFHDDDEMRIAALFGDIEPLGNVGFGCHGFSLRLRRTSTLRSSTEPLVPDNRSPADSPIRAPRRCDHSPRSAAYTRCVDAVQGPAEP
jgi:hypothetical protein